jgi:uncharacterized membrane protein YkoI
MIKKILSGVMAMAMAASIFTFGFAAQTFAAEEAAINEEAALQIALDASRYTDKVAQYEKVWKDTVDGKEVYKVVFYVGKAAFTYRIDAATGEIISNAIKD